MPVGVAVEARQLLDDLRARGWVVLVVVLAFARLFHVSPSSVETWTKEKSHSVSGS